MGLGSVNQWYPAPKRNGGTKIEMGPGHGEGHNSAAAVDVIAAITTKRLMEKYGLQGTLKVIPGVAEELVSSRTYMVNAGLFEDMDIMLSTHISRSMSTSYGISGSGLVSTEFTFYGQSAHGAGSPWAGRSALDAVELMNTGWNFRREHLRLHQRSHYIISNGGNQPNVVPSEASVWYYFRELDYDRIKADDLADPESASALIGRVVATDITPGSTIGESDLLPPGAAAGISGGTPPGRMAISVDRAKVQGVSRLRRGDQFDLLASFPYKPGDAFTVLGSTVQLSGGLISQTELNDQARNELLAEGVIVVDVDETTATIAVRPGEVPGITKALTLGMSVFALARSGRSGDPSKSHPTTLKSDPNPIDRITVIEEIVGDKRKVRIFAADRNKGD